MNIDWLDRTDPLGPSKVIFVRDPLLGLEGILVVDNTACGPAIGGLRMASTVTPLEVFRLARTMTFKSAAAGIPHGGAKAGIVADPNGESVNPELLLRAFARGIRHEIDYIPGPDMGTNETSMAFIHDEISRAVGLPRVLGGIPLDEIGATGHGLAACAEVAQEWAGISLDEATAAIQGFGSVGLHAARFLAERGVRIVAVADSQGALVNPEGFDLPALVRHKKSGRSVHQFPGGKPIANEELIGVPCDIWVPAAQPDVIDADNQQRLQARLVLCGANIPVTADAERALHDRGVVVVPDFIANAGGLICAAVEYAGGTQDQAFATIREKIATNTREVLDYAKAKSLLPRRAAEHLAETRVREAMKYRRRGIGTPSIASQLLDL